MAADVSRQPQASQLEARALALRDVRPWPRDTRRVLGVGAFSGIDSIKHSQGDMPAVTVIVRLHPQVGLQYGLYRIPFRISDIFFSHRGYKTITQEEDKAKLPERRSVPKRNLRVVKWVGTVPTIGVCTLCNRQFTVPLTAVKRVADAQESLRLQFTEHKCKIESPPSD